MLTPKHVLLFTPLAEELERRGFETLLTSRNFRETVGLLKIKGVKVKVLGRYGGGNLKDKLKASLERTLLLSKIFSEEKPVLSVSHGSPEAARAAFGLQIPHIAINDSPHAEAVARLTVPLSHLLLTPFIIPFNAWVRYGISRDKIRRYRSLDPLAWLTRRKFTFNLIEKLGLNPEKPIIAVRPEEAYASYLLGIKKPKNFIVEIVEKILRKVDGKAQLVVLPRYEEQWNLLDEHFGGEIFLLNQVLEASDLLKYCWIFVGGGGTMTTEAVLLGVPSFSYFPGEPPYTERFLIKKGLVRRVLDAEKLACKVHETLNKIDMVRLKQQKKAQKLIGSLEDLINFMADTIANAAYAFEAPSRKARRKLS
jgi:hypothetical protein